MDVLQVDVNKVIPYENNPRFNAEAVEPVANSIKEFGFQQPIVVDKDNIVIVGHTRLKAAKLLGLEKVPIVVATNLTSEQVDAYRLADNKVSEFSDWDFGLLNLELDNIEEIDMTDFGFGLDDLEDEPENSEIEEDEIETDNIPKRAKMGSLFQLGSHRLLCGDATSSDDVKLVLDNQKADTVFTDPPYGMMKEKDGVKNDNLNAAELLKFNAKWIPVTLDNLTPIGSWHCWGISRSLLDIYGGILMPLINAGNLNMLNFITWDKGHAPGENSEQGTRYVESSEMCLFLSKGDRSFNTNSDNYFDGWDPIRQYLANEATKANLSNPDLNEITGTKMASHWVTKSQWKIIDSKNYALIQNSEAAKKANVFSKPYDELFAEYDRIKTFDYVPYQKEYMKQNRAYFDNTHDIMNDVWHFDRTSSQERESVGGHATPKPLALCARGIKSSCPIDGTVLDVFGGSGSTLIAAEETGRKCCMIELDPHYVDVIINRWETLTGQNAEQIN